MEVVKFLLEFGADVNASDYDSRTPLHLAVMNQDYQIVELLVQRNETRVNKLMMVGVDKLSALDLAVGTGDYWVVEGGWGAD
jgi:ankyrin repeat protein